MVSRRGIAYVAMIAALVSEHRGDVERAVRLLERSVALGREAGEVRDTAIALVHLGRHFVQMEEQARS